MRPLLFLGIHEKKPNAWTARDRVLAQAIETFDRTLTESGLPWHIATDPNRKFGLEEHQDNAAALLETERKKREGRPDAPGLRVSVVDLGPLPDD